MPTDKYIISVIIASFNTRDITDECLTRLEKSIENLKKQTGFETEIIVIDNASSDGSSEMISKKHPNVNLIVSPINLGYAKGNNLGLEQSKKSDFILLLNSDVFVETDTLYVSIKYLNDHHNCDVLGCRLFLKGGVLQPSAGFLPNPKNTTAWMLGFDKLPFLSNFQKPVHPNKSSFFVKDKEVEWVMGAYMIMRRKVYENTRGFDENFFMYMEEVEWSKRIRQAGYKIFYSPMFSVIHLDKASNNFDIKKPLTNEIFGLKYYLKKYYPNSLWWLNPVIRLGIFVRMIGFTFRGNQLKSDIYKDILKSL